MANITASSFVQNVKSYSTMPSLDSSAANLATRSILAKNAPFIATSPVCDKRCARSCATRALSCYGTPPLPPYGICEIINRNGINLLSRHHSSLAHLPSVSSFRLIWRTRWTMTGNCVTKCAIQAFLLNNLYG